MGTQGGNSGASISSIAEHLGLHFRAETADDEGRELSAIAAGPATPSALVAGAGAYSRVAELARRNAVPTRLHALEAEPKTRLQPPRAATPPRAAPAAAPAPLESSAASSSSSGTEAGAEAVPKAASLGVRSDGRMNVLFMIADDMRSQSMVYGKADTYTPGLARLAARGVVFDRAYAQVGPRCHKKIRL